MDDAKLANERANRNEDANQLVDILKQYVPELNLIKTINEDFFRNFAWRLRDKGHWV